MTRALPALLPALLLAGCRASAPAPQPAAEAAAPAAPSPAAPAPSSGTDQAAPPAPKQLTLIFSASVAGQLVPCGCSPDQRGGLPRAVAYVNAARAANPATLYVDAGDLLFESSSRPPPELRTQGTLKARVLAEGAQRMGAAARVVGARDLALGPGFVSETAGGVPLLDAGAAPVQGARASVLTNGVGFFAAGYEENVPQTLEARAAELRRQGARLVVLLLQPRGDNTFARAQALAPAARAAGVDLVVVGRRDDPAADPDRKDASDPPVLAVEGHGQSLLRVDVQLGAGRLILPRASADREAEVKQLEERIDRFRAQLADYPERRAQLEAKIKELESRRSAVLSSPAEAPPPGATVATVQFVPLDAKVQSDAEAQKLVDAYDQKVTELNLAEAKKQPESCPAPAPREAAYVGEQTCAKCHATEAAFWEQTRHAHAYPTLVKVNKQFSLDCIRCHVTGWQQPGGVCRIDRTAAGTGGGRQNVQCEACHGAGSEHVKDPPEHILASPGALVCVRCHEAANSPHFEYAKYRPFIIGPGHGAPLARGQKPAPRPGSPLD